MIGLEGGAVIGFSAYIDTHDKSDRQEGHYHKRITLSPQNKTITSE